MVRILRFLITWFIIGWFAGPIAYAADHPVTCSGTITSALQTAINAATAGATYATGDTVTVGVGTCTIGAVTLNKKVTLQGAGKANTHVSGGSISVTDSSPRITGTEFTTTTFSINENTSSGVTGFRFDNNKVIRSGTDASFLIRGSPEGAGSNTHVTGLIDQNEFVDGQILIFSDYREPGGDPLWILTDSFGSATNVVYIEHNTMTSSTGSFQDYLLDSNVGGRYVFRYNTVTNRGIGHHGIQGEGIRGIALYEIYGNTFSTSSAYQAPLYIRSGGGPIFNNTATGSFSGMLPIDNQTSCRYGTYDANQHTCTGNPASSACACDGTNPRDANRTGLHGYPCRDQIGRRIDSVLGHTGDTQGLFPLYNWNNTLNGTATGAALTWDVNCSRNAEHVAENRDYYNGKATAQSSATSPFAGTTGVGYGTLARRPSTCTTNVDEAGGGVAYFATDQGTQGVLYRCSATNTWTTAYTPLTYPHPLAAGGGDTTNPTGTFDLPATASSLTVTISAFTCADETALDASPYCVTITNSSSGCSWAASAQTSITFGSAGSQTGYAWCKDLAGNISTGLSDSVTITLPPVTGPAARGAILKGAKIL